VDLDLDQLEENGLPAENTFSLSRAAETRCVIVFHSQQSFVGYSGNIMDFLPPESAVAFSLSCMHLKCLLGTQHFSKVTSSTRDTLALLNLLAINLPNHVVCPTCESLHNMENLSRYNKGTNYARSTTCFLDCVSHGRENNTHAVTDLFSTAAFKMAMKRYHQQPECTKLLKIMSSEAIETQAAR
jgi:hypothetical protein